jgi:hypothetical protein
MVIHAVRPVGRRGHGRVPHEAAIAGGGIERTAAVDLIFDEHELGLVEIVLNYAIQRRTGVDTVASGAAGEHLPQHGSVGGSGPGGQDQTAQKKESQ